MDFINNSQPVLEENYTQENKEHHTESTFLNTILSYSEAFKKGRRRRMRMNSYNTDQSSVWKQEGVELMQLKSVWVWL